MTSLRRHIVEGTLGGGEGIPRSSNRPYYIIGTASPLYVGQSLSRRPTLPSFL